VSRLEEGFGGLFGGSVMGFIMVVLMVRVRVWGVLVWLITLGTISTVVPCQCERRAFARGVYFSITKWCVFVRLVFVLYFHSPICVLRMEEYLRREEAWRTKTGSRSLMKSCLWAGGLS
jgi:hypothetical protein